VRFPFPRRRRRQMTTTTEAAHGRDRAREFPMYRPAYPEHLLRGRIHPRVPLVRTVPPGPLIGGSPGAEGRPMTRGTAGQPSVRLRWGRSPETNRRRDVARAQAHRERMRAREAQAGKAPPNAPQVARPQDRRAGPTGEAPPGHQAIALADGAASGRAKIMAGSVGSVATTGGFPTAGRRSARIGKGTAPPRREERFRLAGGPSIWPGCRAGKSRATATPFVGAPARVGTIPLAVRHPVRSGDPGGAVPPGRAGGLVGGSTPGGHPGATSGSLSALGRGYPQASEGCRDIVWRVSRD